MEVVDNTIDSDVDNIEHEIPEHEVREAGIIVLRQITNEFIWYEAMKEIRNSFEQEKYFKALFIRNENFRLMHKKWDVFENLQNCQKIF